MKKSTRITIAEDTLRIVGAGFYVNTHGASVLIRHEQLRCVTNSIHYTEALLEEINAGVSATLSQASPVSTVFNVWDCTTLEAASALVQQGVTDVLALNFASAKNPGGGFLNGAQAQEESLARSSGLYPSLVRHMEMYNTNRRYTSCLYTDQMIYSPKVPVFKNDDGTLLDAPYQLSFITAPAVNAGVIQQNEPDSLSQIEPVMLSRIDKLLSVAVLHGHKTLLLGAWGCGVFKNDPKDVAAYFAKHLLHGRFANYFDRVVFAVKASDERFIVPFREHFLK